MTAKNQKQKSAYMQEALDSHVLNKGDAIGRLKEQWVSLAQMEWAPTLGDHEALRQAAREIDVSLIQYALSCLCRRLEEAATCDTARLIAEHVLDTTLTDKSLKRWEAWLGAAPCWPLLAKDNWAEAVHQAARIVVETLTESGVQLDSKAQTELAEQVGRLKMADLLPKGTIERFFPATPEERGW